MNKVYNHSATISNAKKFCYEDVSLIENYEAMLADTTQMWVTHHRLEISENKSASQLIEEGRYYNRPACELIFLTESEHSKLHGANMSEATKQRMSEAQRGNTNASGARSDEAKENISKATKEAMNRPDVKERLIEALTGRTLSDQHKQNISESNKVAQNRPDIKKKKSEAIKCLKWWTNGTQTVRAKECPSEGFTLGRGSLKKGAIA